MKREEKTARFRAMHQERRAFVIPNPWDLGTARIFAHQGFEALATTSAGLAFAKGRVDQMVGRDEALEHAAEIAGAMDLPVSGDFENGFGNAPATVADTVRLAAEAGLAGLSIEDVATGGGAYPFETAVERIGTAMEAARSVDIVLCARADGVMTRDYDVDEAERRVRAYADLGVDCIYAPRLPDLQTIRRFATIAPLNVLMGFGPSLSVGELREAGVGRISLGSAPARAAYGAVFEAGRQIMEDETFAPLETAPGRGAFDAAFIRPERSS